MVVSSCGNTAPRYSGVLAHAEGTPNLSCVPIPWSRVRLAKSGSPLGAEIKFKMAKGARVELALHRFGGEPTPVILPQYGWDGRTRTCDRAGNSRMLYQLSYIPSSNSLKYGGHARSQTSFNRLHKPLAKPFATRPVAGSGFEPPIFWL